VPITNTGTRVNSTWGSSALGCHDSSFKIWRSGNMGLNGIFEGTLEGNDKDI
jgi:hypothetical protein